jgi:hypothetical protein
VILSPSRTTASIPVTASESRASESHVARIHIADHGRFGEGGSPKFSAPRVAEVTLHILEPCIAVIGPGAGARGRPGDASAPGEEPMTLVSRHTCQGHDAVRDIRGPASSAIEGTTTGFASRSGAKAVT